MISAEFRHVELVETSPTYKAIDNVSCFVGKGCLNYAIAPFDMTELRENALNKQSTCPVSCLLPPLIPNHY